MTMKLKFSVTALGALAILLVLGSTPALAQNDRDSAQTYAAGIDLGRTLTDARACTGSGDYRQGCVDGVQESQLDREADQAFDSGFKETKAPEKAPLLAPPPGLFHDPYGKPGDSTPPN